VGRMFCCCGRCRVWLVLSSWRVLVLGLVDELLGGCERLLFGFGLSACPVVGRSSELAAAEVWPCSPALLSGGFFPWLTGVLQTDVVKKLLRQANIKKSINARDKNGWAPLHCAAARGHLKVCKLLINAGADVAAKNLDGERRACLHAVFALHLRSACFLKVPLRCTIWHASQRRRMRRTTLSC
jgi:hypothetical protein